MADEAVLARLMVMQRNPATTSYRAVGFLDVLEGAYEFAYLRAVVEADDFVPLLGFRDASIRHRRGYLFPLFAERVISARRPDRPGYLEALDLSDNAEPWEILGRSGGHRQGDSIELLRVPDVRADGHTSGTFLVHGVRYRGDKASDRIAGLQRGDRLELAPDPENEWNPLAVFVASDGLPLGYVPNPLVEYVQALLPAAPTVTVVRANGPEAGPHMRLLVRVEGTLAEGNPFKQKQWDMVA
ncbi:HIRAN domain-containing protein [Prescottella equi]|uniref:HIRAN domain-containing protein n=1 Tax=Rhodococcus hoagii TaxID=43767 RepID=UPI001F440E9D|nr:HIRAN domain-containing protein [Prescottella equi]